MTSVRALLAAFVARIDRIADQDADPAALTGRAGHRRHGLPVEVAPPPERTREPERTPEEAVQALEELRADQHRRMRGRRRSHGDD